MLTTPYMRPHPSPKPVYSTQEVGLKEQIAQLRSEVASLTELVDRSEPPPEVADALHAATQQRDALAAERDARNTELQALRDQAEGMQERLRAAQGERAAAERDAAAMRDELASRKAEAER